MKVNVCSALLLAAVFAAPLPAAHATGTSNLEETTTGDYTVDYQGPEAESFTTDSGSYRLGSVTIKISSVETAGGGFTLSIWTDAAGLPGSKVQDLVGPGTPVVGLTTYIPGGILPLAPNTTYWVVAQGSPGGGAYNWATTDSPNQTGEWTIADHEAFSSNAGVSWEPDSAVLQMSVSAARLAPVPTLSESAMLLLVAMLGLAGWVRLRRGSAGLA